MFIVRVVLGVVLVLALVPIGDDSAEKGSSSGFPGIGAFVAASAAIEDLGGFCDRQPAACAVGTQALKSLGEHAKQGVRLLQAQIVDGAGGGAPEVTSTVPSPPSQDTLNAADRLPAWRGPPA